MQEQLKSWKAAGLGMHHLPAKRVQNGKMVPEWPKAHTPRPHLAFSHTA